MKQLPKIAPQLRTGHVSAEAEVHPAAAETDVWVRACGLRSRRSGWSNASVSQFAG